MLLFILFRNRCALNLILLFYFIGDAKLSVVNIMVAGCSVLLEGDEVLLACGWHEILCFLGERSDSTHLDTRRVTRLTLASGTLAVCASWFRGGANVHELLESAAVSTRCSR